MNSVIPSYDKAAEFHGHSCPGLALGYRISSIAMKELLAPRSANTEIAAIVETVSCASDSIQFVTGCTFGKGNLFFKDNGKHVYSFINRHTGKSIRIYADIFSEKEELADKFFALRNAPAISAEQTEEMGKIKSELIERYLTGDVSGLFKISPAREDFTGKTESGKSSDCSVCGEKTLNSRLVRTDENQLVCPFCISVKSTLDLR